MVDLRKNRHLDEELAILRRLLVEMSELVDEQVVGAIDAVSNCDLDLARRVRERDDEVDALEIKVDRQCERILAWFTPVAVDLRLIIAAVKVNTDLERIGDNAKSRAKKTQLLARCTGRTWGTKIREVAALTWIVLLVAQGAFLWQEKIRGGGGRVRVVRVAPLHWGSLARIGNLFGGLVDRLQ